jgi:hypothetical protein
MDEVILGYQADLTLAYTWSPTSVPRSCVLPLAVYEISEGITLADELAVRLSGLVYGQRYEE